MKAALYCCILLVLFICAAIWKIGTPVDDATCPREPVASGPLATFITQYFNARNGADWRDDDNLFSVLGDPAAQAIARAPKTYYCEALGILQSQERTQTEKVHTVLLMLSLPIDYYLDFMDRSHELYQRGLLDESVLSLVVFPRATALDYWWLPQWRSRFKRDAPGLYSERFMEQVLSAEHWLNYPGQGF